MRRHGSLRQRLHRLEVAMTTGGSRDQLEAERRQLRAEERAALERARDEGEPALTTFLERYSMGSTCPRLARLEVLDRLLETEAERRETAELRARFASMTSDQLDQWAAERQRETRPACAAATR